MTDGGNIVKELTKGFDIAGQISGDICTRIFQISYLTGGIPDRVTRTNPQDSSEVTEVFLDVPWLHFINNEDVESAAVIDFRFIARLFPETVEVIGSVSATVFALLQVQPDGTRGILATFANIPNNPRYTYPNGAAPQFIPRLESLISSTLYQKLKQIPISPFVKAELGFFTFRGYAVSSQYLQGQYLGIFVNQGDVQAPAPKNFEPFLFTPETFSFPTDRPKDQMRIAIPRENILPILSEKINQMGLPKESPNDSTITINSLSMDLQYGYLKVWGNATKEIDVLWDPDIDFEVKLGLWIDNGALRAYVKHVNADLPWWAETLHFILPIIGTYILQAIKDAMQGDVGSGVGALSQDALPVDIFSSNALPNTLGVVKVSNDGPVDIMYEGLLLPAQVAISFTQKAFTPIPYAFGHDISKEFHTAECEYRQMMNRKNIVRMINPLDALRRSYNGCYWCYPQYNFANPGSIEFRFFDSANEVNFMGEVRAERVTETTLGDLTFKPSFSIISNFAIQDTLFWRELIPGQWKIEVRDYDGWQASCLADVPDKTQGTTFVTATRGKPNCNWGVGTAPAFP